MGKRLFWAAAAVVCAMAVGLGFVAFQRLEGSPPQVTLDGFEPYMGSRQEIVLTIDDAHSGLRKIHIELVKDAKPFSLLDRQYPADGWLAGSSRRQERIALTVDPAALGLTDGEAILRIDVRDHSWRRWWHGNLRSIEKPVRIDTRPAQILVLSQAHNVNQGGSGLVVYRLNEACRQSGVRVGDQFFPGFGGRFADPLTMVCFFALSHEQGPGTRMAVEATDMAGNASRSGFAYYIRPKSFPKDTLRLSDAFMTNVVGALALDERAGASLLDRFLHVNRDLRIQNDAFVHQISAASEAAMHWEGTFVRMPAAPRAAFADRRDYVYQNAVVDKQTHMGVDLAALARSPVPAANRGKVVHVGDVGIYGQMVMIDHGCGLMSMYAHLSSIDVQTGQVVEKGQIIGRTGTTGLAGGDHLHFAMLVHTTFVNPVEWWDEHWITDNVTSKLKAAAAEVAGG